MEKSKNWWTVLLLLGFVGVSASLFRFDSPWLGVPATVLFLAMLSIGIGSLLPAYISFRPWLGFIAVLGALAASGSLMINFYHLSRPLTLLALAILTCLVLLTVKDPVWSRKENWKKFLTEILPKAIPFIAVVAVLTIILVSSRTDQRTSSAWDVLPPAYWFIYGLLILLIARSIFARSTNTPVSLIGIILASLVVHLTLSAVYATAYGTDIWRHLAMEKYLAGENTLGSTSLQDVLRFQEAKNVNGGFWALLPMLQWLSDVPLENIHFWFTPILTAIAFPLTFFLIGQRLFKETWQALLVAFASLLSFQLNVYGMIINPQSLGLVFLLQSLFFSFDLALYRWPANILYGLSLAGSVLTYPVTAIFSLAVTAFGFLVRQKHWLLRAGTALAILSPLLLIFLDLRAGYELGRWFSTGNLPGLFYQNNPITLLGSSLIVALILWLMAALGINILLLNKTLERTSSVTIVLFFVITLLLAVISAGFKEQPLFLARTYQSLHIFLVPLLAAAIAGLIARIYHYRQDILLAAMIGMAVLATAIYKTPLAAASISGAERKAIELIEREAGENKYAVLTDETTAGAGNCMLGFSGREYPYYWYAGGFLFDKSWEFGDHPSLDILKSVKAEFGVDLVYVIVTPVESYDRDSIQKTKGLLGEPIFEQADVAVFRYSEK